MNLIIVFAHKQFVNQLHVRSSKVIPIPPRLNCLKLFNSLIIMILCFSRIRKVLYFIEKIYFTKSPEPSETLR